MLGGDDQRAFWNVLPTANLVLEAADLFQEPERRAAPLAAELLHEPTPTRDEGRQPDEHQQHRANVEEALEDERSQEQHDGSGQGKGSAVLSAGPCGDKRLAA